MNKELTQFFDVVINPLPFSNYRIIKKYPINTKLTDILDENNIPFYADIHIFINEKKVDSDLIDKITIQKKCRVIINTLPKGGGKGKSKLRTIAQIALMTLTPLGAGGKFLGLVGKTAKIVGSIVTYGLGNALINSVLPPQQARLPQSASSTVDAQFQSITGISNNLTPNAPIPVTFGTDLVYPVFGAKPHTYVKDNKQFLRAIFVIGKEDYNGQLLVSNIKIGNNSITNFTGVEIESNINYGIMSDFNKSKWFPNIITDSYNILILKSNISTILTSQINITAIELELTFNQGLVNFDNSGSRRFVIVDLKADYREVGSINWLPLDSESYTFTTTSLAKKFRNSAFYTIDNIIHIFGGTVDGVLTNLYHQYNMVTDTLVLISSLISNIGFENMGIDYNGSYFILTGGYNPTTLLTSKKCTKIFTNGTFEVLNDMAKARSNHISFFNVNSAGLNKRLLITGGEDSPPFNNGSIEYIIEGLNNYTGSNFTLWGGQLNSINYNNGLFTKVGFPNLIGAHINIISDEIITYHTNIVEVKAGNGANKIKTLLGNGVNIDSYIDYPDLDITYSLNNSYPIKIESKTMYKLFGSDGIIRNMGNLIISDVSVSFTELSEGIYSYYQGQMFILSGSISNTNINNQKMQSFSSNTTIKGNSTSTIIKTFKVDGLKVSQYEVRVSRVSTDNASPNVQSKFYLTAIRNYLPNDVIIGNLAPNIKTVCLDIQASEKLTGVIDTLNMLVTRKMPIPSTLKDGTFDYDVTSNPASAVLQCLLGSQAKRNLAISQIDWVNVRDWYDFCETNNITFDHTQTGKTKLGEMIENIARAGMATQTELDGKRKFIFDAPQSIPIQMFTQRNILKDTYEIQKRFVKVPDSLIVRYRDKTNSNWDMVDAEVFNDGFNSTNATEKESIDFVGATDFDYVYKMARRYLADLKLRQELHTFSVSIDSLVSTKGDLIEVSQPNLLIGDGVGRIKTINDNGVNITSIELDYSLRIALSTTYEITVRTVDTVNNEIDINKYTATLDNSNDKKLNFNGTLPILNAFISIDLVTIGINQKLIIKEIKLKKQETADLMCVPYDANVYTSDTGTIPPFTPTISIPVEILRGEPEAPIIDNIRTDITVMYRDSDGSLKSNILITLKPFTNNLIIPQGIQARYKRSDDLSNAWIYAPQKNADTLQINLKEGIEDAVNYDIAIRYTSKNNSSQWIESNNIYVIGKTLPPEDVINFTINTIGFNLEFSWDNVSDIDLWKYILKIGGLGDTFDTSTLVDEVDDNRKVLSPLVVGDYKYFLKAKDTSRNLSTNSATLQLTVIAPKIPDSFTGIAIVNQIQFGWTSSKTTWRIQSYKIYKGNDFNTATLIKDNSDSLGYLHTEVTAGTYKYWIQATDIAGNVSTPTSVSVAVDAPTDFNFFGQYSGNFSLAEATTSTNILYFNDNGVDKVIPCIDSTKTWTDHFIDESVSDIQSMINNGYIYYLEPIIFDAGGLVVNASYTKDFNIGSVVDSSKIILTLNKTVIDFDVTKIRPTVKYKKLIGDAWTIVQDEMIVFANNFQYMQIVWDFLATTGRQLISLNEFTFDLSIQKKTESNRVIANNVSSVTIITTTTFLDFQSISVTQLFDTGYTTNLMKLVVDISNEPTSFDIKVFNSDGTVNTTQNVLISYSIIGV